MLSDSPAGPPQGYELCEIPDGEFGTATSPLFVRRDGRGFALRAEAKHCNARGAMHGGMLRTLARPDRAAVSLDVAAVSLNCDLVSGAAPGDLIEGRGDDHPNDALDCLRSGRPALRRSRDPHDKRAMKAVAVLATLTTKARAR